MRFAGDMALSVGTKLGPYQTIEEIGAGGIGEVYRATDSRLDRTVAVKVVPGEVADDPDRRREFLACAQRRFLA